MFKTGEKRFRNKEINAKTPIFMKTNSNPNEGHGSDGKSFRPSEYQATPQSGVRVISPDVQKRILAYANEYAGIKSKKSFRYGKFWSPIALLAAWPLWSLLKESKTHRRMVRTLAVMNISLMSFSLFHAPTLSTEPGWQFETAQLKTPVEGKKELAETPNVTLLKNESITLNPYKEKAKKVRVVNTKPVVNKEEAEEKLVAMEVNEESASEPLEFESFSAEVINNIARLKWVDGENRPVTFMLEKSRDGKKFEIYRIVDTKPQTERKVYIDSDKDPFEFYRMVKIVHGGNVYLSKVNNTSEPLNQSTSTRKVPVF